MVAQGAPEKCFVVVKTFLGHLTIVAAGVAVAIVPDMAVRRHQLLDPLVTPSFSKPAALSLTRWGSGRGPK